MRSGKHTSKRRKLSVPDEAWELMDLAAARQIESWTEWARGKLAIAAAQELGLDEAETVALFDRV